MKEEISEYQKSAALMSMDIDTLSLAAESDPDLALDFMRRLKEMKENVIHDKATRDTRFRAASNLMNYARNSVEK